MRWLLFLILGGALVVMILVIFKKRNDAASARRDRPVQDLSNLRITDARVGDALSISGFGDNYEDLDFTIDRRNRYESGDEEWFELSGRYKGRRVFVEFYEDDELEIAAVLDSTTLTLAELGITEDDLIRMDEDQSRSAGFDYDGRRWSYESSQEAGYFKDGRGQGEGFYCWEFSEDSGQELLFVEKWEGSPFEAGIAKVVPPQNVRIFRA